MNQEEKFKLDEQKLIENFVKDLAFNESKELEEDEDLLHIYKPMSKSIEIIVRPECTQKCEYCYIINHGKELYPYEERLTKEELINNFKKIINFFDSKHFFPHRFELFAGDLFFDDMAYELFEILYNFYLKIIEIENSYYQAKINKHKWIASIGLPLNASFIEKEENIQKNIDWYNKFEKIGIGLNFSLSVDGKYATCAREKKSEEEVDEYYAKILNFCKITRAGIHPMISAASIEYACENYDWWYEQYHSDILGRYDSIQPMTFEVRNPYEWTNEKIEYLKKYLNHVIEHRLQLCDNSIEHLAYHLFVGDGKNGTLKENRETDPIKLIIHTEENVCEPSYDYSCSLSHHLHIVLSNFAIVPCHRMSYYHYIGGWFNVNESGELDGTITPNNVSAYIGIKMLNCSMAPKCHACPYNKFCMKGCIGAQYEYSAEPFLPIPSVCKLFQEKFNFLVKKYQDMGVLQVVFNNNLLHGNNEKALRELVTYIREENKEGA